MSKKEVNFYIAFLAKVPFFSEVSKSSLEHLCSNAVEISYSTNETIFKKNDLGESMYVIMEGSVKVHEGNYVFNEIHKGDFWRIRTH